MGEPDEAHAYAALEAYLKVLASASRLELLSLLRAPRSLEEIRLRPPDARDDADASRSISRQAVQAHLDRLMEAGVVRVGTREREGRRDVKEYSLDHARLFAIVDELRRVCALEPRAPVDATATQDVGSEEARAWRAGPKLVLVHGVNEGRTFALDAAALRPGRERGWVIGRDARCQVRLDYDPYVSHENAEVVPDGSGHRLVDIRSARNGTSINWMRLPAGGEAPLRHGDVIGVGRSLLLYRAQ